MENIFANFGAHPTSDEILQGLWSMHDETFGGLLILRPEGRLFFANVQNVATRGVTPIGRSAPGAGC